MIVTCGGWKKERLIKNEVSEIVANCKITGVAQPSFVCNTRQEAESNCNNPMKGMTEIASNQNNINLISLPTRIKLLIYILIAIMMKVIRSTLFNPPLSSISISANVSK